MKFQTIPILRIFDEQKAKEFYLGFLSMNLDWEHRFEIDFPVYKYLRIINLTNFTQDFFSFSTNTWMCVGRVMQEQLPRRINRRIAGYATIYTTQKTDKKIRKALAVLML